MYRLPQPLAHMHIQWIPSLGPLADKRERADENKGLFNDAFKVKDFSDMMFQTEANFNNKFTKTRKKPFENSDKKVHVASYFN